MSILSVCVVVNDTKISVIKNISITLLGVFPAKRCQENKEKSKKHCKYWEQQGSDLLSTISIEGPVVHKKNWRLPFQTKEFCSALSS